MDIKLHPEISINKLLIGNEKTPLLVIDNFVADADELAAHAVNKLFVKTTQFFPGIRAKAPLLYRRFLVNELQELLFDYFQLPGRSLRYSMCHYSLVTTPTEQLLPMQRVPHIDAVDGNGLASVHYLFKKDYGGTAFYQHRGTGFEYVDADRQEEYFRVLSDELSGDEAPAHSYINGDTRLFKRVGLQSGIFNRVLIYRRNSLHSGSIGKEFVPDKNPLTGRLSINCFIDVV